MVSIRLIQFIVACVAFTPAVVALPQAEGTETLPPLDPPTPTRSVELPGESLTSRVIPSGIPQTSSGPVITGDPLSTTIFDTSPIPSTDAGPTIQTETRSRTSLGITSIPSGIPTASISSSSGSASLSSLASSVSNVVSSASASLSSASASLSSSASSSSSSTGSSAARPTQVSGQGKYAAIIAGVVGGLVAVV